MFEVRPDEQQYARLRPDIAPQENLYGDQIDLVDKSGQPACTSLRINGDDGVGDTQNRNKQHGFHFTADNCIGCHACEAACSEKNDLAPHLSFRSVGYVEGGTYPDFTRVNVSMACNHCDDPVCLKGCPTRAYTKHPEYGAVIQDPDICFGCGYCTWVCPYNAPQLDHTQGVVEKCNMCVDRLEVGLKPACVSACLGNALDFGVVETIDEKREQAKPTIPGFPDPEITHPNIRFQQTNSLPREFTRTDSMPVKYHLDEKSGAYIPEVDPKEGDAREWNLAKLSSRENPLVLFTLGSQAAIGGLAVMVIGALAGVESLRALAASGIYLPIVAGLLATQALMLFISTQHLGRPMRFYRGFNNLRHSPLSREAAGVSAFMGLGSLHALFTLMDHGVLGWWTGADASAFVTSVLPFLTVGVTGLLGTVTGIAAALAGLAGLYFMQRIYRIPARPFWNHWQVATSFYGTMLTLGALAIGLAATALPFIFAVPMITGLLPVVAAVMAAGMVIEAVGLVAHARDLVRQGGEGAAAQYLQTTRFGYSYIARNVLIGLTIAGVAALGIFGIETGWALLLWAAIAASTLVTVLVGRALFYVLVIPTTMPGAFFWRNKGFEEHARETGLAKLPQVGVLPDIH